MDQNERQEFLKSAPPVAVHIGPDQLRLLRKSFSTGSLGWHVSGKIEIEGYLCQVNILATIIGSKPVEDTVQPVTQALNLLDGALEDAELERGGFKPPKTRKKA